MFEEAKSTSTVPVTPSPLNGAPVGDIVIHAMPREFYGKEASLLESAQPKPEVKPPAPLVVPPPPPPPLPPPVAKPVAAKKRSWGAIIVMGSICLLVLGIGGYGAYRLVVVAGEQRAAAEAEVERLKQQAEDRAQAEEDARQAAAEAAANAAPTPAKDTDSDGLTDVEELLYGTDFRDPDTDNDSYLDGNEVFHRYHPLGTAPATLLDTGAVKIYDNTGYPFSVYYPATWNAKATGETGIAFTSSRQASIRVAWSSKNAALSLADWLQREQAGLSTDSLKETLTKQGYYGYITPDDRTAYLDVDDAVVTMVYDLGGKTQIEYLQTFQMMVNSFVLVAALTPVAEQVNPTP